MNRHTCTSFTYTFSSCTMWVLREAYWSVKYTYFLAWNYGHIPLSFPYLCLGAIISKPDRRTSHVDKMGCPSIKVTRRNPSHSAIIHHLEISTRPFTMSRS